MLAIAARRLGLAPCLLPPGRQLHAGRVQLGLEEFFPAAVEAKASKTGRSWSAAELRIKSFSDLHKLWYVLLKERNMLLTLKKEAKICDRFMPAPERIRKVRVSMNHIQVVLGERERARKAAVSLDSEKWIQLREKEGLTTLLDLPRKPAPIPDHKDQVLGIRRGGLANPGRPQRMMTKQERAQFKKDLRERRKELTLEQIKEGQVLAETLSMETLAQTVKDAEFMLQCGFKPPELPVNLFCALKEAQRRNIPTFFDPGKK